jgi:hypothetical protein
VSVCVWLDDLTTLFARSPVTGTSDLRHTYGGIVGDTYMIHSTECGCKSYACTEDGMSGYRAPRTVVAAEGEKQACLLSKCSS